MGQTNYNQIVVVFGYPSTDETVTKSNVHFHRSNPQQIPKTQICAGV